MKENTDRFVWNFGDLEVSSKEKEQKETNEEVTEKVAKRVLKEGK